MPRVYTKTKSSRGAERRCSRCGQPIKPGETYYEWAFRYGGTRRNCFRHRPRQSELTQSAMGDIYSAVENAQDQMPNATTYDEIKELVESVATAVQEVVDQYREADEAFGGHGATESAQRADELEGWQQDLESWEPSVTLDDDDDADDRQERVKAKMREDGFSEDDEAEWISVLETRMAEEDEDSEAAQQRADTLEQMRDEANEAIDGCPI